MKKLSLIALPFLFTGCASLLHNNENMHAQNVCRGNAKLPVNVAKRFVAFNDLKLLNKALGKPNQGGLCQGAVYKSKPGSSTRVYRVWNSTNPNSEKGHWWSFHRPVGKISQYRSDFEICYQWSPLDKLISCTLNPGVEIVVGTGQSAECSKYHAYPVSDKKQIFIDAASTSVSNCKVYDSEFKWKRITQRHLQQK